MNVWKDNKKQLLKRWTDSEKCHQEIIKYLSNMFGVDEIERSFYRVSNNCGGTDSYLSLPDGRQVCLVECSNGDNYLAELYLIGIM